MDEEKVTGKVGCVKEIYNDLTYRTRTGKLCGHEVYRYRSPTHWSDAICTLRVTHELSGEVNVRLNWGSGGVNKDFSELQVAKAMSIAFDMASIRIKAVEDTTEACKALEKYDAR